MTTTILLTTNLVLRMAPPFDVSDKTIPPEEASLSFIICHYSQLPIDNQP